MPFPPRDNKITAGDELVRMGASSWQVQRLNVYPGKSGSYTMFRKVDRRQIIRSRSPRA